MSKYQYTEVEQQINRVLIHQDQLLKSVSHPDLKAADMRIAESESLLKALGYQLPKSGAVLEYRKPVMVVPNWESLCLEAEKSVEKNIELETIFSADELAQNTLAIKKLKSEYNELHHLDKFDIAITAVAAMLGAAVDILLVGIPQKTPTGLSAGTLSNFIRSEFEKRFPENEMEKLANSKLSKVPFDAQDNRHTQVNVDGLSAYYHRLLSLGHDPLLGFIFGVADILNGRMTTIDKNGKVVSQIIENYAERKESDIYSALVKQVIHFKSDITTSMGLPAPLMSLFNFLQIGSIGEEEQTIAEIVQGMYYQGYDFIHFCSMSVSTMLVELVIRMGYAIKRIKEGHPVKDSIPISLDRTKHPKLETMLWIGNSAAWAMNTGKLIFTKNPMSINYPQWLAFGKYSYSQLKWVLLQKPDLQNRFIEGKLYEDMDAALLSVDQTFSSFSKEYIVVIE